MRSERLYVSLAAADVAMFRFLLEAYDNLALFTVLARSMPGQAESGARQTLLKLRFAPGAGPEVDAALADMAQSMHFNRLVYVSARNP